MMSVAAVREPVFPLTSSHAQNCSEYPQRSCPRWGEYDVIIDGRDCRQLNGLSRFRTNFDCCHTLPVSGEHEKFEGYMLPRPFSTNTCLPELNICHKTTMRHVPRSPQVNVFPKNSTTRQDSTGEFILRTETRNELQKLHRKLYCTPRYGVEYPEFAYEASRNVQEEFPVDSNSDHSTFFSVSNVRQPNKGVRFSDDCDGINTSNIKLNDHSFVTPPIVPSQLRKLAAEKERADMNKNFYDILIPSVYNYRIPSALHYPDDYLLNQEEEPEDDVKEIKVESSRFLRPLFPASLHEEVALFKKEIEHEMPQTEKKGSEVITGRRMLPNVDTWINSSVPCKLTLSRKSDTQKRHNSLHPEESPDLRDFTTHSKRMFFHGFNSSTFRG